MSKVQDWVSRSIASVYEAETPEELAAEGIDVFFGGARFEDAGRLRVRDEALAGRRFLIVTGARPKIPDIPGLVDVPFLTSLDIFEATELPERLLVIGSGPQGCEISQAYARLGSRVTMFGSRPLPREDPDASAILSKVFDEEGITFVPDRVDSARLEGGEIVLSAGGLEVRGDALFIAVGRRAAIDGLDLDAAGVAYSEDGIVVDGRLRTSAKQIFAAGDCVVGNDQFTHLAGWQAARAVQNALIPGYRVAGFSNVVPRTTFTDPEVAHVGLLEPEARARFGDRVLVTVREASRIDRAITDGDPDGFLKVVHLRNGRILGATIVAERAGEVIAEVALAMDAGVRLPALAQVIHPYPTYSIALQQLAGDATLSATMNGSLGGLVRRLVRRSSRG
jgi:pyruvate/2-oxoglutarate dehydrogenase complex dihydrolipoamide dehydrogenase (E3) component